MKEKNQRKKSSILILPTFQFKFIGFNILCFLFLISTFYGMIFYYRNFFSKLIQTFKLAHNHPFSNFVFTFLNTIQNYSFIIFGVTLIIILILDLYVSHLLAGPVVKLKNHIERHLEGEDVGEIKFRKKDNLDDLAEMINKIINK